MRSRLVLIPVGVIVALALMARGAVASSSDGRTTKTSAAGFFVGTAPGVFCGLDESALANVRRVR